MSTPQLGPIEAIEDMAKNIVGRLITDCELTRDENDEPRLDIEFDGRYRVSFPATALNGVKFYGKKVS